MPVNLRATCVLPIHICLGNGLNDVENCPPLIAQNRTCNHTHFPFPYSSLHQLAIWCVMFKVCVWACRPVSTYLLLETGATAYYLCP